MPPTAAPRPPQHGSAERQHQQGDGGDAVDLQARLAGKQRVVEVLQPAHRGVGLAARGDHLERVGIDEHADEVRGGEVARPLHLQDDFDRARLVGRHCEAREFAARETGQRPFDALVEAAALAAHRHGAPLGRAPVLEVAAEYQRAARDAEQRDQQAGDEARPEVELEEGLLHPLVPVSPGRFFRARGRIFMFSAMARRDTAADGRAARAAWPCVRRSGSCTVSRFPRPLRGNPPCTSGK
jgi:hypothetical protein